MVQNVIDSTTFVLKESFDYTPYYVERELRIEYLAQM